MNKLKVLDLFSGIGGFSLGLERTGGFETVAFCEIDKHAQKVLKKHWPKVPIFEDVIELKGKDLKDIDVICGGFPCQDISVAGKQKGLEGERSGLWTEFKRLIKEIKPRYAIIENVANLRSKGLNQVLKDLWEIGYASEWHLISASAVGAPHLRERIWIIAYPNGTELRKQSRRSSGKNGESAPLLRNDGQERIAPNAESARTGKHQSRLRRQSDGGGVQENRNPHQEVSQFTDAHGLRLWRAFASEEEASRRWAEATAKFHDVFRQVLEVEPAIRVRPNGVSEKPHSIDAGMDPDRIEILKEIVNSGRVFVDQEKGKIYSLVQRGKRGEKVLLKGAELNGYTVHKLFYKGKKYAFRAHQLVLASDGQFATEGLVIDHINRDKKDNRLSNLRIATPQENYHNSDRCHIGLSEGEKEEIAEIYWQGEHTLREVAELVGISKSRVQQVVSEYKEEKKRKEAIKQLGNAVVPQIPQLIGEAILEWEQR